MALKKGIINNIVTNLIRLVEIYTDRRRDNIVCMSQMLSDLDYYYLSVRFIRQLVIYDKMDKDISSRTQQKIMRWLLKIFINM